MQKGQVMTKGTCGRNENSAISALSHFIVKERLGEGAYGEVKLVERDDTTFALKIIHKKQLEKDQKQYQAIIER